jgi:hypothetical protein
MTTVTVDSTLVERPTLYGNTDGYYNVAEVIIPNVPTLVAGGAGQAVTTSIAFSEENLPEDLNYVIQVTPDQACAVSYDNKSTTGFDVILTPLSGGVTLAAGTMDIVVTWPRG